MAADDDNTPVGPLASESHSGIAVNPATITQIRSGVGPALLAAAFPGSGIWQGWKLGKEAKTSLLMKKKNDQKKWEENGAKKNT